jgi:hypothetical protein
VTESASVQRKTGGKISKAARRTAKLVGLALPSLKRQSVCTLIATRLANPNRYGSWRLRESGFLPADRQPSHTVNHIVLHHYWLQNRPIASRRSDYLPLRLFSMSKYEVVLEQRQRHAALVTF